MTERTPNTLFDRLVARTAHSIPTVDAPLTPIFDRFEEEITEEAAAPDLAPPGRAQPSAAAAPEPRRSLAAAGNAPPAGREIASPPAQSASGPKVEPPAIKAPAEATAAPVRGEPAREEASAVLVRTLRETRILERIRPEKMRDAAFAGVDRTRVIPDQRAPEVSSLSAPPVVEPDLPPAIPPSSSPTASAAAPQPQPSPEIHVTIGRLEIRGGEAPKSAGRRQRSPQGPTLEQFLNRRRGGDR